MNGAPPGTDGSAYPSGWMTIENFLLFLKHFVKHVKPTTDHPVLLLLDNHESHLAIQALDYAKDNGITMLSFPPHFSHRLQPLDISVFGPLKKKLSQAQSNWLRSNPGKPISIYEIASILCDPWKEALTMTNICSGFQKAGIFPFNNETFSDSDFMPADVTDRPYEKPIIPNEDPSPAAGSIGPVVESVDESSAEINRYLQENNICVIPVRGDGHCLMYAVCASLDATRQGTYTVEELGNLLAKEVAEHHEFYRDFVATNDLDLTEAVRAFLVKTEYNNNSCDIFLNAICNALNLKAVVIRRCDTVVRQIEVIPGRPGVDIQRTVHLVLHGSGFGAHYNSAVLKNSHSVAMYDAISLQPGDCAPEPTNRSPPSIPDTTTKSRGTFSPEVVKPHPKAPKRNTTRISNRKRRKTCILTDTPEKEALREEQEKRKRKQQRENQKRNQTTKMLEIQRVWKIYVWFALNPGLTVNLMRSGFNVIVVNSGPMKNVPSIALPPLALFWLHGGSVIRQQYTGPVSLTRHWRYSGCMEAQLRHQYWSSIAPPSLTLFWLHGGSVTRTTLVQYQAAVQNVHWSAVGLLLLGRRNSQNTASTGPVQ